MRDNFFLYLGRVLKVDGAFAAVRFPNKDSAKERESSSNCTNGDDIINLLQDCRLMRKDDLQVSFFPAFLSRV